VRNSTDLYFDFDVSFPPSSRDQLSHHAAIAENLQNHFSYGERRCLNAVSCSHRVWRYDALMPSPALISLAARYKLLDPKSMCTIAPGSNDEDLGWRKIWLSRLP
jgi:hypothetical protein